MGIELGLLARLGQERLSGVIERLRAAAIEIFDLELEASGGGDARDRRRIEAECDRLGYRQQLGPDLGDDLRGREAAAFAPGLEHGKGRQRVRLIGAGEEVQARDGNHVPNPIFGGKNAADLLGDGLGPL